MSLLYEGKAKKYSRQILMDNYELNIKDEVTAGNGAKRYYDWQG